MAVSGDDIARVVLQQFSRLPKRRQPQSRSGGKREWVPLSGIVVEDAGSLRCVALGTGMKCLPAFKVPNANGNVLHDWHAEVVCMRAFNRFLLDECRALLLSESPRQGTIVCRRKSKDVARYSSYVFGIRDHIKFHMYCSEAPCGDASMELTIAAQDDATPWTVSTNANVEASGNAGGSMNGRGFFANLGEVRRKPSRPDAPPTLSKSCSDKLALRQCLSLLSCITASLIDPTHAYLSSVTLPTSQYSRIGCERAFGITGRMSPLVAQASRWDGGFSFQPFRILTTEFEFSYSRRSVKRSDGPNLVSSNSTALWTPQHEESLIGGVLQGRKVSDPRGASVASRRQMMILAREIVQILGDVRDLEDRSAIPASLRCFCGTTYASIKHEPQLAQRRNVKEEVLGVLKVWIPNSIDDFVIEQNDP